MRNTIRNEMPRYGKPLIQGKQAVLGQMMQGRGQNQGVTIGVG
jgi:hypothetical protein